VSFEQISVKSRQHAQRVDGWLTSRRRREIEMDDKRRMLRHFLAALAYRTQKALRDAPDDFGTFAPAPGVRSPMELVRHMTSVLGYARTMFVGGHYRPDSLDSLQAEVDRFHAMLGDLADHIDSSAPLVEGLSLERLLQGPFADAMTHVGQLALLRRLRGSPVPPENFVFADIDAGRLGADQPTPARPDEIWPEAPPGWIPPSRR
jgi:hypothetical protein